MMSPSIIDRSHDHLLDDLHDRARLSRAGWSEDEVRDDPLALWIYNILHDRHLFPIENRVKQLYALC